MILAGLHSCGVTHLLGRQGAAAVRFGRGAVQSVLAHPHLQLGVFEALAVSSSQDVPGADQSLHCFKD